MKFRQANEIQLLFCCSSLEAYQCGNENQESPAYGLTDRKHKESLTLEFFQSWLDKVTTPIKFEASDLVWSSYFVINERIAYGFRRNKALIIGNMP